jgi:hypothetical protein
MSLSAEKGLYLPINDCAKEHKKCLTHREKCLTNHNKLYSYPGLLKNARIKEVYGTMPAIPSCFVTPYKINKIIR